MRGAHEGTSDNWDYEEVGIGRVQLRSGRSANRVSSAGRSTASAAAAERTRSDTVRRCTPAAAPGRIIGLRTVRWRLRSSAATVSHPSLRLRARKGGSVAGAPEVSEILALHQRVKSFFT